MNRRRVFLQVLSSGVVGLSLCDVEWIPTPITSTQPLSTGLLTGLDQITAAIAREVGRVLDLRGEFVPGDYALGMAGMTDQFAVNVVIAADEWTRSVQQDRIIVPAAYALAERVRDRGLNRFGALPLPPFGSVADALVATDEQTGVTVRGLRAFNIGSTYMRPIYKEEHDAPPYDDDDDNREVIWEELVETSPHWVTRFDILAGRPA